MIKNIMYYKNEKKIFITLLLTGSVYKTSSKCRNSPFVGINSWLRFFICLVLI